MTALSSSARTETARCGESPIAAAHERVHAGFDLVSNDNCAVSAASRPRILEDRKPARSRVRLDLERAFHPCNISTKETNDRGDSSHEGDRGDGPGCGNSRDEAGRAARAAGGGARQPLGRELRRCHCPGHASGFTGDELAWPSTWIDRLGRDRTPSIPGHELAGVVTALSYGTTGLSVGQRVFGLTDWTRDGTLAEYVAVEARNLAPLPGDVDFSVGAALVMPGLTAW